MLKRGRSWEAGRLGMHCTTAKRCFPLQQLQQYRYFLGNSRRPDRLRPVPGLHEPATDQQIVSAAIGIRKGTRNPEMRKPSKRRPNSELVFGRFVSCFEGGNPQPNLPSSKELFRRGFKPVLTPHFPMPRLSEVDSHFGRPSAKGLDNYYIYNKFRVRKLFRNRPFVL
jgi:hypothetical protein